MVKFSTSLVLVGLLFAPFLVAVEKPRDLSEDDRSAVLLKIIAVYSIDRNFTAARKQLETLQQQLVSAVEEHHALSVDLAAKYKAPEGCTLNDQAEWVCVEPAVEPAATPPPDTADEPSN